MATPFRDRIKELRRVRAGDLRPHALNWRRHPQKQRDALHAVLSEIGWADAALVRELPDGELEIIDGHLRSDLDPDAEIPVLVLDVDERDAAKILATLDPLASLAEADAAKLDELLRGMDIEAGPLKDMLDELAETAGVGFGGGGDDSSDDDVDGNTNEKSTLSDRFIVPPFSVLDARQGYWQDRKRAWLALGIQSELGRGGAPGGSPRPAARLTANGHTARGDGKGRALDG